MKQRDKETNKASSSKGSEKLSDDEAVPAVVEGVLGRTGTKGEITQVSCRILQGRNRGKQMRRNVRGPVARRDILILRETEIESRRIQKRINKGGSS
tara:strand:- start:1857 stop:2147 length:291 start_codon:yes stop_codon:yes gene_type:complete